VVGVELQGEDAVGVARAAAPVAEDEGHVGLARLDLHPRLVQGEGTVGLDVALDDGRPGADGVDGGHEAEGLPGEVVAAAVAPEVHLGARQAGGGQHVGDDRQQQLDRRQPRHVGGAALGEGDDPDVTHQRCFP
jgi:hypothetical protein